jgi:hypothetical protein
MGSLEVGVELMALESDMYILQSLTQSHVFLKVDIIEPGPFLMWDFQTKWETLLRS